MKAICADPRPFQGSPETILRVFPSQKGSFLKQPDASSARNGRAHGETSASRECGRATSLNRSCWFCSDAAASLRLPVLDQSGSGAGREIERQRRDGGVVQAGSVVGKVDEPSSTSGRGRYSRTV